jgi:Holliday junction resolvase RusA-like endonuclease
MIDIIVEVPPLSINKAWQGRRYKTPLYNDWLRHGLYTLPRSDIILGSVEVWLTFGMRYPKKADVDNPIKCCLDLLVKRGYLEDDVQVQSLHVTKEKAEKEYTKIKILEL